MRVEVGGHVGMPLIVDGETGGGGFAVLVRLGYQDDRHFERDGFGERGGGDGDVLAVENGVRLVRVDVGANHRDADGFRGRVALFGANFAGFGVGVLAPEFAFELRRLRGHGDAAGRDFGKPCLADEPLKQVPRRVAPGDGGADFARVLVLGTTAAWDGDGGNGRSGEGAFDFV